MENVIEALSYERDIIQLKLLNVPKHPKMIARMFTIIKEEDINIDMISQVTVDHHVQIEITLDQDYQLKLNNAILKLKDEFKQLEIYQIRKYSKIAVGGQLVETTPGLAAKVFETLGNANIHFYQITTIKRTIYCVIDKDNLDMAIQVLKEQFNI